jgi:phage-related protein
LKTTLKVSNYRNFIYLYKSGFVQYFKTVFLKEADDFLTGLPLKVRTKIIRNIEVAEQNNDPKLFKKLHNGIWEFRINFGNQQIRLLAFWDKTNNKTTLVLATHGFIKKVDKIPSNEIKRAVSIRNRYFENNK